MVSPRCTMMTRLGNILIVRCAWPLVAAFLMASPCAVWLHAEAGPETLYTTALADERGLRQPGAQPTLNDLRAAISRYEAIVRRFPLSAFDDHSLWHGAGLALDAYDRYRQPQDLDTGVRLLRLLAHNHPTSSLASRVPERLERLQALTEIAWLTQITRERLPETIRVTMSLDREVTFYSEHLTGPERIYFDLRGTQAPAKLRNAILAFSDDDDIVRSIRLGRHSNDITRVVLDTEASDGCHAFSLYDPFRLVVDCHRAAPAVAVVRETSSETQQRLPPPLVPFSRVGRSVEPVPPPAWAAFRFGSRESAVILLEEEEVMVTRHLDPIPSSAAPPSLNSDGLYSVARQLGLGVSRIVIDPGHGGHDPGARGPGVTEADLVLDLALRLETRIAAALPGLEVVLTRRGDDYLPLEARTTLANRVEADLFLSIHANASKNPLARGIETYFLDFATGPEAESVAARENVGGHATMKNLDGLLETIAANSKLDESRDFAQVVQDAMVRKIRPLDPTMPDLGVKQAPFVVLIGARMPSILSEVSFVTNEQDAALLGTDAYRDELVDALLDGVVHYQSSLGTEPVVALANNR